MGLVVAGSPSQLDLHQGRQLFPSGLVILKEPPLGSPQGIFRVRSTVMATQLGWARQQIHGVDKGLGPVW